MSTPNEYQKSKDNNETENELKKDIIEIQVEKNTSQGESNIQCNSKILSSKMITECNSNLAKPVINTGLFPVRVPIIIAQPIVNINIENTIELPRPAIYIKSINRRVLIDKCSLIPEIRKVFLSGTIKKNIEYSEAVCSNNNIIEGDIKNITVNTLFDSVTEIEYIVNPVDINKNYENNIKVYKNNDDEQVFTESYSEVEKIYCQLIHVSFEELNLKSNRDTPIDFNEIYTFKTIKQKMAVHLTIRLIQNQNVYVLSQSNNK
ncbi:hypothetical protein [Clostridium sp. JN-1]|uniref:hypothetical protein n=1 Tax=Clostridium sp. JN-1 TaxID=2483110 RepID=UPI000F0B8271|nr:hypothetical protein [Clostridium sp. JN-1]